MSFRPQEAVQPQPALDLLTAIGGTKSLSTLDGFCRGASLKELLAEGQDLEAFRHRSELPVGPGYAG